MSRALFELAQVIKDRRTNPVEGSYTCYLLREGIDKTLKKVGEEAAEAIIAAKNGRRPELVSELADLFYHLLVTMELTGVSLEELSSELERRAAKIGNLKKPRETDRAT